MSNQPVEIFLSYAHQDESLVEELVRHLKPLVRQGLISTWYDRDITQGELWNEKIIEHLERSQIILLLISPNYLASDYCYDVEMSRALQLHATGVASVIPLILRPVDWSGTPFNKLQALPKNAKPLTSWADRDEVFREIVEEIRKIVELHYISSGLTHTSSQWTGTASSKVFISYSHQDSDALNELTKHLKPLQRQGEIEFWVDQKILPGTEWANEIQQRLETCDIILILLSPAYLASEWLQSIEMPRALERSDRGEAKVIPILISPINLSSSPISRLQFLPRDGKPITTWIDRNEAWLDVIRGLRNIIRNLPGEKTLLNEQFQKPSEETEPSYEPLSNSISSTKERSETYEISRIFKTAGIPELNYEEPNEFESFKIELQTLGKGLAVEGPSGIGKTSTMRRVFSSIQPALHTEWISAISDDAYERIDKSLNQEFNGYLIIDDFHHLSNEYKDRIARAIKLQSEQDNPKSKIIVIGVNRVRHMLMDGFPELTGRVGIISMSKQPDEKIQAMIEKGEKAANIVFRSRAQIVEDSYGSFFTAQYLCLFIARKAHVTHTQSQRKVIDFGPTDVMNEVLEQFEFKYRQVLNRLASVDANSSLKGAGLVLLWLLRREDDGYVLIDEAKQQYPDLEQNFNKLVDSELKACFDENESLTKLFFYDSRSGILVFEDPQLAFYLRNLRWTEFARHAGHQITISEEEDLIFRRNPRVHSKLSNQFLSLLAHMQDLWNRIPNPVKVFLAFGLLGLVSIGVIQVDNLPFNLANQAKTENDQIEMVEVQILIQTEDGQPIGNVEIQVISQGAPTTIYTNSSGYARLEIPSRDDVDIVLRKQGYEVRTETINLSTDPRRNKSFRLRKIT